MAKQREYDDEPEDERDESPRPRRRPRDDDDYEDDDRPRRRRRVEQQDLGKDPMMRMLVPLGRSGWAIAAGYLGLISVLCFPAPFALFAGLLAIRDMKRNPEKHGMGRAIFGLVMGSIGSVLIIVALISMVLNPK